MELKPNLKRVFSLFLSLVMVVGILPGAAFARTAAAPVYDFGPAGYVGHLTPGIYDLTVQMKKDDNHNKDSMAAGCIKGGSLEVMKNGDAYVSLTLGSHTMMGLTAFASNWQIYNEFNTTSALINADIVTKDGSGNVTEIRFKLPYTDQAGIYAKMHVQAGLINMDPSAFLKMLFHQAKHNSVKEAAKLDAIIAALGEVTLGSEAAITEARNSYDWLVAESKALVKNLSVLTAAEARLAELKDTRPESPLFDLYGSSMTLGSSLRMEFYVEDSKLAATEGVYAVITKSFADGHTSEIRVPYAKWLDRADTPGVKYIPFDGVAAKEMMDRFTVQIFDKDGKALSEVYTDSIQDYALRMLRKENKAALKTLLVDMLNYGAEAQKQFRYDEAHLANAALTAEEQKLATQSIRMENRLVSGKNYAGTAPSLNNNIRLSLYFTGSGEGLTAVASYVDHYGKPQTVEVKEFDASWTGHYGVHVDTLAVADFARPVEIQVRNAQGEVLASATDSIASYAARMSKQNDIYEAMVKFGASSYAFFH